MTISKHVRERMDSLKIIPRLDLMQHIALSVATAGRCDASVASIWAEKLRFTYSKTLETVYPEFAATNGDVLPIDTSVPPGSTSWEYYMIDHNGYADWIDDDGDVMPTGSLEASRFTGETHEMGHEWDMTIFDLERAAYAGMPLSNMKQNNAKRTHDAKTNYVWLFGESAKNLPGLCNHPNIPVTLAPLNVGATSRLWANKTVDEIAADLALLIDQVPTNTIRAHHVAKVFFPLGLVQELKNRRLGAGDGFASVWDWMRVRYEGADATGQPKVEFHVLNECTAANRLDPKTGTDTSGMVGDFLLAIPADDKDSLAFIRARPYTQRPPQELKLKMVHQTHSKIGGVKMQQPLALHRLDFGLT